jgi:hypothetical protein
VRRDDAGNVSLLTQSSLERRYAHPLVLDADTAVEYERKLTAT